MAIKIKVIHARDFLKVTPDGVINITTSRQLLVDIAKAGHHPIDHELLIDFRDTSCSLSSSDAYQLAAELCDHGDTFCRKVALLVLPGLTFDRARFFQTCTRDRGFSVHAFTSYETAMRWMLSDEDQPAEASLQLVGDPIPGVINRSPDPPALVVMGQKAK